MQQTVLDFEDLDSLYELIIYELRVETEEDLSREDREHWLNLKNKINSLMNEEYNKTA